MRESQASYTAALVALGRASVHGHSPVRGFSDPIAEQLLPAEQKAQLARLQQPPAGFRETAFRAYLERLALAMSLRTVAIDDVVRQAPATSQVVILGAGLDGRAWRLTELNGRTVFEVDHPATQAWKRERTRHLAPIAEVRFVPVNFERDSLDARLAEVGHDARLSTVWIWEGVVMYLRRRAIEATLDVVSRRSAPGSRLALQYSAPDLSRRVMSLFLRFKGEPFRSHFKPPEMATLVRRFGFRPLSDESCVEWYARYVSQGTQLPGAMRAQRLVVAEKQPV